MFNIQTFIRLINPVKNKIYRIIGRAILTAVENSEKTQKLQIIVLKGDTRSDIERFENYGNASYPLIGAEILINSINGNTEHGIVSVVHDRRYRPDYLSEGDVAVYSFEDKTGFGHKIHFKKNREIEIFCTTKDVDIEVDKTLDIGNDYIETISNDKIEDITRNKSETVGGNKTEEITGNKEETITGNKTEDITGDKEEIIAGNKTETVTKKITISATGDVAIDGANITITALGNAIVNATAAVQVNSPSVDLGGVGGNQVAVHDDSTTVVAAHSHKVVATTTKTRAT